MRIVTWNMRKGPLKAGAWDYLRDVLRPDVALVQEARKPALGPDEDWHCELVTHYAGTAIYTRGVPLKPIILTQAEGRAVAAQVPLPDGRSLTLVSIHAKTAPRVFPRLERLIKEAESLGSGPAIIGGDLNTARNADAVWPGNGHGRFWETIDAGRLHDCHFVLNGREQQTFFRDGDRYIFQCDHLFVTPDLASAVRSCQVVEIPQARTLSDHDPVVVELDL